MFPFRLVVLQTLVLVSLTNEALVVVLAFRRDALMQLPRKLISATDTLLTAKTTTTPVQETNLEAQTWPLHQPLIHQHHTRILSENTGGIQTRRSAMSALAIAGATMTMSHPFEPAWAAKKMCTDIESCREIGEKKVEEDLRQNPITTLPNGVQYKVLRPGTGTTAVKDGSKIDLIYSISQASGSYMYSQGFGFNKVKFGGKLVSDLGLDSLSVVLGRKDVPTGVEQALVGMKKGERRRVIVPPNVGFETSGWKPEPTDRRGKAQIIGYRRILEGNGSTQPPFPAPTIWDVEVMTIKT